MNARLLLVVPLLFSLSACIGGEETCTVNDVTYDFGDTFDAPDGCNQCVCGEGGAISCTLLGCIPDEPEVDGGAEPEVDGGVVHV